MKKTIGLLLTALLATASLAQAHSLWINAFQSHGHQPPYAMVSLGWGHALPMDDILVSSTGRIGIERFELIDPEMKGTQLLKPSSKLSEPELSTANIDLYTADMAGQKVALKKDGIKGVYQFGAVSKANFYTKYIDSKGRQRMKLKPMDEVKDVQKVLMAIKYQAFAKSFMTVGEWAQPAALGHGLEIIPRTDLSNLRAGDLVEVEVLFYGKPLHATAKSADYIRASSSSFGQSDGFGLISYIKNGRAQFRVQSAGQWMINVSHKEDVTVDGPLKDLHGKAEQVYHGASLTFNVR